MLGLTALTPGSMRWRQLLADFVVKVFWSLSARATAEFDSYSGSLANKDSPESRRSYMRFYQSYALSDQRSTFATKSAPLPRAWHQLGTSENSVTFTAPRPAADRGKMTQVRRSCRRPHLNVGDQRLSRLCGANASRLSHVISADTNHRGTRDVSTGCVAVSQTSQTCTEPIRGLTFSLASSSLVGVALYIILQVSRRPALALAASECCTSPAGSGGMMRRRHKLPK
jgi:hypothetical protein